MKKPQRPRDRSLLEEHSKLFAPFPINRADDYYDLRQPDFRPMITGVVSGGAGQAPVETWSTMYAKLGGSP